jgi:hypothetical protein
MGVIVIDRASVDRMACGAMVVQAFAAGASQSMTRPNKAVELAATATLRWRLEIEGDMIRTCARGIGGCAIEPPRWLKANHV